MSTLQVHLLGTMEISCQGQPLPTPPTLKSQALLAYLILHRDQPQPRDRLAGLFWGDRPERKARRSLTTALWHIRRGLPAKDWLPSDVQTVQFVPQADLWLDVEAFAASAARDDLADLRSAVDLYRGDFLLGLADDWIVSERYRLQTRYEEVLARLVACHEARGEHRAALTTAQRLLARNPLREQAYRAAMRAYGHLGRRNAALEQYQRCQEILQEELAVEPAAETTALYQAIREGRFAVSAAPTDLPAAVPAAAPVPPPVSSPLDVATAAPFVGREEELATLQSHWQRAQAEKGGLVLISGEAGVGKTRLVAELTDRLRWQGARVLTGRCYEFERTLPYQPFAEALRGSLPTLTADRLTGLPRRVLGEVARLVPELGERDPELTPAAVGHSGQEQARLFDGLARFLAHWSTQEALLLILEDLHWAGQSTLQLLHYLARQLAEQPVLLVGTFRPEEVCPKHPLRDLRRGLAREGLAQLLTLTPLSTEAVELLLVEMSGAGEAVRPLARRLYRETAGNPFFLIETVKACFELEWIQLEEGVWQGDFERISRIDLPLPLGVREVIQARVGRLGQEAQDAVRLAAVLGREFDYEPLELAWDRGEEATLEALDELLRRRLIEEGTGAMGRDYAFSHHKIQEAVYAGLPQRHRQHLHARVGLALEQLYGNEAAGELAHHFLQGSEIDPPLADKAVRYLLLAGDVERLAYAHQEAIDHYEQALALLKEEGQYERAARTLMKLGLTYHNAFAFARSHVAYDAGFALWQQAGKVLPTDLPSISSQTLRIDWTSPGTLDPIKESYWAAAGVISQLFSGLVALSPELDVVPDVAQSWEVLDEGRRYVFHLREEAHWSDGTPLTAEDFIFAWHRQIDPDLGQTWSPYIDHGQSFIQRFPEIRSARATGRHTLVVELERPTARLLFLLGLVAAYPVPRHVLKVHGEKWAELDNLVCNGPFMLASRQRGRSLVCVRNPAYHGQVRGNVQQVELALFTEPEWADRLAQYENDELDVQHLWMLPLPEADRARQRHAGEYLTGPSMRTGCLFCDVSRPPFDDIRVRRAFGLAVDREQLANVVLRGYMTPAGGGFLPPGVPGHTPGMALPFDPDQARHLLAEAGYSAGRGFPCIDLTTWAWPGNEAICAFLQAQWRENLGVKTTWESLGEDTIWEKWAREPPHISPLYPKATYPDPSSLLTKPLQPQRTHWRDKAYERLIEQAETTTGQGRRLQFYRQADRLLIEEAVCIPLLYFRSHLLVKPWVRQLSIVGLQVFWKDVILEPEGHELRREIT